MHKNPLELWSVFGNAGRGVIVVLLVMSVLSMWIAGDRFWAYRRAARASRRFAPEGARLMRMGRVQDALAAARAAAVAAPLAHMMAAGLEEWQQRQREGQPVDDPEEALFATREALRDAADHTLVELRRGLSVLATVGSTAPFVGLFGTTFGIIDAFALISATGSGGMGVISGSIAEALYTTALGLVVALPAIWAYNFSLSRVDAFAADLDRARHQLLAFLLRTAS
jgi:biopolymer transport protein ExbB/biopolymer transport protein TolQ